MYARYKILKGVQAFFFWIQIIIVVVDFSLYTLADFYILPPPPLL